MAAQPPPPPPAEELDAKKCADLRALHDYEDLVRVADIVLSERDELGDPPFEDCKPGRAVTLLLDALVFARNSQAGYERSDVQVERDKHFISLLTSMWTSSKLKSFAALTKLAEYVPGVRCEVSLNRNSYGYDGRWTMGFESEDDGLYDCVAESVKETPKWHTRGASNEDAPDRTTHFLLLIQEIAEVIASFQYANYFGEKNGRIAALVLAWILEQHLRVGVPALVPLSGAGYVKWHAQVRHAKLLEDPGPMMMEILITIRHAIRQALRLECIYTGPAPRLYRAKRRRDADDDDDDDETGQPAAKVARPLGRFVIAADHDDDKLTIS